jgi:hypothetical protein
MTIFNRQQHLASFAAMAVVGATAIPGCADRGEPEATSKVSSALGASVTLVAPSGTTASTDVTFSWTAGVLNPDGVYRVWVTDGTDFTVSAATAGCDLVPNCSHQVTMTPGSYGWYITEDGGVTWGGPMEFTVPGTPLPPAPTSLSPSGMASASQAFSWLTGGNDATVWRIWMTSGLDITFTASELGCAGGGTCTTPALALEFGSSGSWYVSGQNSTGWGPWAGPVTYTVGGTPLPPAATSLSPSGAASTSQVFSWLAASTDATDWRLWTTAGVDATFTAAQLNCVGGGLCTTPNVTLPVGACNWYVSGKNTTGWGPWAGPVAIDVNPICATGQDLCNRVCTTLASDAANCGTCGNICVSGLCGGGQCCSTGQSLCNGMCASLASDPRNCGACGNICLSGHCRGGHCRLRGR